MDRDNQLLIHAPRSFGEILDTAVRCYRRYPVLFLVLALVVVGPYDLIVLAATGSGPLGRGNAGTSTILTLDLLTLAVVGPFISALHVNAVGTIGDGGRPGFRDVGASGVRALPVVAAAQIVAAIGIGLGLVALIVPGILLAIRWAVVAQAAAIERTDWIGALRRSNVLTRSNMGHVLAVVLLSGLVGQLLRNAGAAAVGHSNRPGQVALGIAIDTLVQSFAALLGAILYFDLRAREKPPR